MSDRHCRLRLGCAIRCSASECNSTLNRREFALFFVSKHFHADNRLVEMMLDRVWMIDSQDHCRGEVAKWRAKDREDGDSP